MNPPPEDSRGNPPDSKVVVPVLVLPVGNPAQADIHRREYLKVPHPLGDLEGLGFGLSSGPQRFEQPVNYGIIVTEDHTALWRYSHRG
jgi:hypothetical protein